MNKSTDELNTLLKNTSSIDKYLSQDSNFIEEKPIGEVLTELLNQRNLSKADVINKALLDRTYGYQIFSGQRTPSRDKVIAICFAIELDEEATQSLLKKTGYPPLYVKNKRDSIILYALINGISLFDTNEMLLTQGEDLLIEDV